MSLVLELTEFERKLVRELHSQDGYRKGTAVALGCSVSSLARYIGNILKRTGFDARKVDDRIKLLELIPTTIGYTLTAKEREIISTCCKCNMNMSDVSRLLNYHRNTVRYYRESIKKKTGLDLRNFYHLTELQKLILLEEGETYGRN